MTIKKYSYRNGKLGIDLSGNALSRGSLIPAYLSCVFYQHQLTTISGTLLDLGCGTAPLEDFLDERAASVVKCDWQNSFHVTDIDVEADLNAKLPFEDARFDTIVLSDVLEHIHKPHLLLSEVKRILKCGGMLIGNSPFIYLLHEEPYDYHRYTKYYYSKTFEELGFTSFELYSYGTGFELISDFIMKFLNKMRLGWLNVILFYFLKKYLRVVNITNSKPPKMSLGYGFIAIK
jgi:SAM-dependent methyltransferase